MEELVFPAPLQSAGCKPREPLTQLEAQLDLPEEPNLKQRLQSKAAF